jgi:UDP-2,3-diacylglucosamine hydrolase
MPELPVVFFSDVHLGAESKDREAGREARLHDFLNSLAGRASRLVIVGDLFDFWFEYRTAIPRRAFATLAVLKRLREDGMAIDYLNGNHDFWLGPFLANEMGIATHDGAMTLEKDGRRLWIHHGDGIIAGDHGYRFLKRVLRNPASIALYRWLHPDLGIPLAHHVSNGSRHAQGQRPLPEAQLWNEIASPKFREGYDAVILGHFHHAFERRENGRELFVLGDWIRHFTWLELAEGRLTMRRWGTPAEAAR